MMRLAEDGMMFTIARFEKRFSYLQGYSESSESFARQKEKPILFPALGLLKRDVQTVQKGRKSLLIGY